MGFFFSSLGLFFTHSVSPLVPLEVSLLTFRPIQAPGFRPRRFSRFCDSAYFWYVHVFLCLSHYDLRPPPPPPITPSLAPFFFTPLPPPASLPCVFFSNVCFSQHRERLFSHASCGALRVPIFQAGPTVSSSPASLRQSELPFPKTLIPHARSSSTVLPSVCQPLLPGHRSCGAPRPAPGVNQKRVSLSNPLAAYSSGFPPLARPPSCFISCRRVYHFPLPTGFVFLDL